jgi:hypothetical protein
VELCVPAGAIVYHILSKGSRGSFLYQSMPDRKGFIAAFQFPDAKVGKHSIDYNLSPRLSIPA